MTRDELYMQRCFDLALLGAGHTTPNPMVGAVLVHRDRIIGEGFHARYGGPHAEVNAVESVPAALRPLIPESTLYVSLEPCCITGRTGPCTNLILQQGIPEVVVSCLDLTPGVSGRGIEILQSAGVKVTLGILEKEGQYLSRIRNHFVTRQLPYVILKYAVTPTGLFAPSGNRQAWITGPLTRRLTHRLRSETAAILVGDRTVLIDDPQLDNRFYFGQSPIRIVIDRQLRLPQDLKIFDGSAPTWIINELKTEIAEMSRVEYIAIDFGEGFIRRLLSELYRRRISSLLVEGGAQVIQSFYNAGLWQEAHILTGNRDFPEGITAPHCPGNVNDIFRIADDTVRTCFNPNF